MGKDPAIFFAMSLPGDPFFNDKPTIISTPYDTISRKGKG
jgi:hypothetical protein